VRTAMQVEKIDRRGEKLRVRPESEEDLWTLKTILRPGDLVKGKTIRDVQAGGRGSKEKKPIIVKLRVKNVEFQPFTGRLRLFGVIVEGPEEYGVKGKHQSILVTPGTTITIEREGGWSRAVLEKLRASGPRGRAVIVAVDYDEYAVAVLSPQGIKMIVDKYARLPGKDDPSREDALNKYVAEVVREAVRAVSDYGAGIVVIVGPGPLKNVVAEKLRASAPNVRVFTDDASMGGRAGVEEALRRQKVVEALREYSLAEAERVVEEFLRAAARDPNTIASGPREVAAAARLGAVDKIVVVDEMLYALDDEVRELVNEALEEAEKRGATIIFVPRDSPAGEKIYMMGGIIAVLRYPLPPEARNL